jgi:hypothetical protein
MDNIEKIVRAVVVLIWIWIFVLNAIAGLIYTVVIIYLDFINR